MGRVFFDQRKNVVDITVATAILPSDSGNLVEGLKDGDTIYYDKHAGHAITWKDDLYQVIQSRDVVLVE